MKAKVVLLFFVCILLSLSTYTVAFAEAVTPVEFPGLGTVSIPSNIEAFQFNAKGTKMTSLIINDQNLWRSVTVMSFEMSNASVDSLWNNPSVLEGLQASITASLSANGRILRSEPPKFITLGERKAISANQTVLLNGLACNFNIYIQPKSSGIVMALFISSDSDARYWQPIITKIITEAKE